MLTKEEQELLIEMMIKISTPGTEESKQFLERFLGPSNPHSALGQFRYESLEPGVINAEGLKKG